MSEIQCKHCGHIMQWYRGGMPDNCRNCGEVLTWANTQRPDRGAEKREEYRRKQAEIFRKALEQWANLP